MPNLRLAAAVAACSLPLLALPSQSAAGTPIIQDGVVAQLMGETTPMLAGQVLGGKGSDVVAKAADSLAKVGMLMRATLYHGAVKGLSGRDSLGCKVSAMRTLAVDTKVIPRRSIVFIKETVGLPLPDGGVHDGRWYASDTGGAIKGQKLDLFTGLTAASMKPFMAKRLNVAQLTVTKVGEFKGCPPLV